MSDFRATNAMGYKLARGLGYFSVGLGLLEMAKPGFVTRSLGLGRHNGIVRLFGLRELGAGAGILAQRDPTPWVWARVGGDALDILALLGGARARNPRRGNAVGALIAVLGVTALDVMCARELTALKKRAQPVRDYSNRSGFNRPAEDMRGKARRSNGHAADDAQRDRAFTHPQSEMGTGEQGGTITVGQPLKSEQRIANSE